MKARLLAVTTTVALSSLVLNSCGTSLYRPFSVKDSPAALREETILQLNQGNYEAATDSGKKLWDKDKSNETASLYSIALASRAGVGLFDLIVSSIQKTSNTTATTSTNNSSSTGNDVFNTLSTVLPSFTAEQLALLKTSIEVLDAAPEKASTKLLFQRCLTAAIYTIPTLKNLQSGVTSVQTTLQSLPTKLGSGVGTTCNASTETINSTASELSSAITQLGQLTTDFSAAMAVIGECFPSAQGKDAINTVSQQVSKLNSNADKGCSVPTTQKIGNYTLPSCLNDTISATGGNTAAAGDGKIAGCELFINCTSGNCF